MPSTTTSEPSEIVIRTDPDSGETSVNLMVGGRKVSWLSIIPFTLRIGAASVRMDGIGGVGTDSHYRRRGYSRRVLEAAIDHMRAGDGALSMLYGISDFYPKFGYATAGPDYLVLLTELERDNVVPTGWSVRDFVASDLPAMKALYARRSAQSVGTAVRPAHGGVWSHLTAASEEGERDSCHVVIGPEGTLHGYVWRARWCWYVKHKLETDFKDALVLGEVMADGPIAADAVLAVCRQWAQAEAEQRKVKQVVLAFPPEGALAAASMRQEARFVQNFSASGDSMARVLDVTRLLRALAPELQARLQTAHSRFVGALVFETDLGDVTLHIALDRVIVEAGVANTSGVLARIAMPQTELARLALGAFPPDDLLARLPQPPNEAVKRLLAKMFPLRFPHMCLPDRY
jgi:predicted acetyltransferase